MDQNLLRVLQAAGNLTRHGIEEARLRAEERAGQGRDVRQRREAHQGNREAAARQGQEAAMNLAGGLVRAVSGLHQNIQATTGPAQTEAHRVVRTTASSVLVLGQIVTDPRQLKRLLELITDRDLIGLLRGLATGNVEEGYIASWIRNAGGYFPKFAQVLSQRPDLIKDRRVLEQFARCMEDMPVRPRSAVQGVLAGQGWSQPMRDNVGDAMSAGSVAQVNECVGPDGSACVLKTSFEETRDKMQVDFELFKHARAILGALNLEDEVAQTVGAMFEAVQRSRDAVLREFELMEEERAIHDAREIVASDWPVAHRGWLDFIAAADSTVVGAPAIPAHLRPFLPMVLQTLAGCQVEVPTPLPYGPDGRCSSSRALIMEKAGGESVHKLLTGDDEQRAKQAVSAVLGIAVPFIGYLLLCRSSDGGLAHADPHPGNFRWEQAEGQLFGTLWVLDWGSNVRLSREKRQLFCLLIEAVAANADDHSIAESARRFGVSGPDDAAVAQVIRGMLNATAAGAAQQAIEGAAVDRMCDDLDHDVVPVIRCLAMLGGMLQEMQKEVRRQVPTPNGERLQLSLAALWVYFAQQGLQG
eukprot:TRINITY_DN7081_c0_g1_i2.p1 TRINITY_DN7081_c0_g1~~TRINITY_DN7081_c0_g1_i2.p1  ORF type:complete len:585 (-),score=130.82 TRINITY_DN7081_c0_g1_i2:342-2096(-)